MDKLSELPPGNSATAQTDIQRLTAPSPRLQLLSVTRAQKKGLLNVELELLLLWSFQGLQRVKETVPPSCDCDPTKKEEISRTMQQEQQRVEDPRSK